MASRLNRACGRQREKETGGREERRVDRGTLDQVAKRQKTNKQKKPKNLRTQRPRGNKKAKILA